MLSELRFNFKKQTKGTKTDLHWMEANFISYVRQIEVKFYRVCLLYLWT